MANYETWDRDDLYGEVWSTPMKTLAAKYGISDVGLAKVCRKLMIPLPGRGHWAKKEAGQNVKQLPLPPLKEKVIVQKPTFRPPSPKLSDLGTATELTIVERLERASGEFKLKHGSLSHPLVIQARAAFKGAKTNDHGILWTHEPCLDVRVSKESLDRALRIMAGLISITDEAGFSVSVENRERRTQTFAKVLGEEIRFGLVEKINRIDLTSPPEGGLVQRMVKYGGRPVSEEPSGKLSITVWTSWGSDRRRWSDGKVPLEEQLPHVVAGLHSIGLDRPGQSTRAGRGRTRAPEAGRRMGQIGGGS